MENGTGKSSFPLGELNILIGKKVVANNMSTSHLSKTPSITVVRGLPVLTWRVVVTDTISFVLDTLWIPAYYAGRYHPANLGPERSLL